MTISLPPSSSSPSPDDSEYAAYRLIGQTLGPYRIDSVLGRGGMGVVYLARHQQIGQEVAIKVLRQRLSNDRTMAERLLKEARAVTLVQHTGLVHIYDYQQTPEGSPYIVMERLRGQPLAERIQSTERSATALPLPVDQTLRIGEQVAAALAAAHAAGIIHCDLKPENIFLTEHAESPGGERVKILDFGIAKFLNTEPGKQTSTGMVLGTPKYISPEQCDGRESVSGKSDVYSLGIIMYEMLAGAAPFHAKAAMAFMRQHMVATPPPLRERAPQVPKEVHDLIHLMLIKEPQLRPDMTYVLEQLRQLNDPNRSRTAIVPPVMVPRRRTGMWLGMCGLALSPVLLVVLMTRVRPPLKPPGPTPQVSSPVVTPPVVASPARPDLASPAPAPVSAKTRAAAQAPDAATPVEEPPADLAAPAADARATADSEPGEAEEPPPSPVKHPAKDPGKDTAKDPGKDTAKNPGKDAAKNPGKDAAKNPGKDTAKNPGKDTAKNPAKNPDADSDSKPSGGHSETKHHGGKHGKHKGGKTSHSTSSRPTHGKGKE